MIMEKNLSAKSQNLIILIVCQILIVTVYCLVLRHWNIVPIYENCDDFFLKLISSGELTGTPEAHLRYISFTGGMVLKALYTCLPSVSWYGVWLLIYLFAAYSAVFFCLSECVGDRVSPVIYRICVLAVLITEAVSFWAVPSFFVQYTTVTIVVAAASAVLLYCDHWISSEVFFAMALILRTDAALMMLPFLIAIGTAKYLAERPQRRKLTGCLISLVVITILVMAADRAAYSGEWRDYIRYDKARQTMVDYAGYPDYDGYADVYESYGISREAYMLATTRDTLLFDEGFDVRSMTALADLCSRHDRGRGLSVILKDFIERSVVSYVDRPVNLIVFSLYILCTALALIGKKKRALLMIASVVAARMVIWGYLLYIDRLPTRISTGVYIAENVLLLAFMAREELYLFKGKRLTVFTSLSVMAVILAVSVKWGLPHTDSYAKYVYERLKFIGAYGEMRDYMYENGDDFYLLDINSFRYLSEPLVTVNKPTCNNYVYTGCWPSNTPWTEKLARSRQIESYETELLESDRTFIVFMDSGITDHVFLEDYYSAKYGNTRFYEEDTVYTSNGLVFKIMGVRRGAVPGPG